ncbi:MAG: terminase TerL endonuclease subunit [Faecousia sp.]
MNHYIQEYIDLVRSWITQMCREQYQLADLIEHTFATETLIVDEDQLERYMGLLRHFPFKLLPWESFLFALHNCVYTEDGELRWPCLVIIVGRGAGKNGYLAFEDFALLTPINGVKNYNIDIFATAEDTARATFDDIYEMLEGNRAYFEKYFTWTKEEIVNKATRSKLKFRTSSPKTKDSFRPGKVDFDEVHAYENSKLIDVAVTGLGKRRHPRRTYITTMGDVRDGPLDKLLEKALKVLRMEQPDNGWLYFICRLDSDAEIMNPEFWAKANPSLCDPARPELYKEILLEFEEYKDDPAGHSAFATKRMNRPQGDTEAEVASWENIKAASTQLPHESVLMGRPAVFGIDYASTQDFVAAGILILVDGTYYWITHSWVCAQSKSLSRIQFPLKEAETRKELTMVDAPEISPEIPVQWVSDMRSKYQLIMGGIDHFRYTLLSKAFAEHGFDPDRKKGNLKLTYSPEQSMVAPLISSAFLNHKIVWGDNMLMRWYTNNAIRIIDKRGNITYGKIEPKSRKTDGFMALVAAFIVAQIKMDALTYYDADIDLPDVFVY